MATERKIIEIVIPIGEAVKAIASVQAEIAKLTAEQKRNKQTTDAEREQYAANTVALQNYRQQLRTLVTETNNQVQASTAAVSAYDRLQAEYALAAKEAKNLAIQHGAGSVQARAAADAALAMNQRLREADATVGQHQRNVGNYTSALQGLGRQFLSMLSLTAIVAGLGNTLKDALNTITDFDKQMAQVAAITMATKEQMQQLREIAIQYGGSTKFTAGEVAGLQAELGKLGYTTQQVIDATGGITMSAAATGESLQKTAEIVGSVTMAFGLSASESKRVADVMSQSFNSTALGLDNFSESIKYVAPVAKQAGVSLEETTALLGLLANSGIKGSMAGTALRQIMSELVGTGGNLQDKLKTLAEKGLNLAGAQDEVGRSAKTSLLILKDNVGIIPKLTSEFENSAGASEIAAAKMMDTISGKTTFLKSTWDGFVLSLEDGNGALSKFLKKVLDVTAQAISGFQRLTMSIEDKNKAEGKSMALTRLTDFEKELSMQEDKEKYINQEIIAEKNLVKAKEDKIKVLKNELIENEKKGFFMQSTGLKKANELEISGLRNAANNSIAYINQLGNLRRAKLDQNTLQLKNSEILDKNNSALNKNNSSLKENGKITDAYLKKLSLQIQIDTEKGLLNTEQKLKRETFLVEEQLRLQKITKEEHDLAIIKLGKKNVEDLEKIAKDQATKSIELLNATAEIESLKQEELLAGQKLSVSEKEKLDIENAEKKKKRDLAINAERLKSDKDYKDQSILIEQQFQTNKTVIEANAEEQRRQQKLTNEANFLSNKLALAQGNIDLEAELKKQQIEAQRLDELSAAQLTADQITAINAKAADAKKKIDKEAFSAKLDMAAQVASGLAELFGKETKAGKFAAAAAVGIESAQAAFSTGATAAKYFAKGNLPMGILAGVQTGIIIAKGVKAIKEIYAVKEPDAGGAGGGSTEKTTVTSKFHSGGTIDGTGEVPITALGGESVMNVNTTQMFSPLLSSLNQLGGGKAITANVGSTGTGTDMLAAAFSKALSAQQAPQIVWKDFETAAQRAESIKQNRLIR